MGKFVITKRGDGEYQFNLKSNNGLVILTSEGYSTKANCESGIESVKHHAQDNGNFERRVSNNRKIYFNLKAANGQVIGTSQMYSSDFACDKGITSVMNNAAEAKLKIKLTGLHNESLPYKLASFITAPKCFLGKYPEQMVVILI